MAPVLPARPPFRPRPTTRRFLAGRLACVVAAALLCACDVDATGPRDGEPRGCAPTPGQLLPAPCRPGDSGSQRFTTIPVYTKGRADGSGWSTQPLDQPRPMPSPDYNWFTYDTANCAWTTPELLTALGKTGGDLRTGPIFCTFYIDQEFDQDAPKDYHEQLQIQFDGPYSDHTDTLDVAFMRSITVAGLEAREYDLKANQAKYPGSCTVEVNTRSLGGITVMGGTSRAEHQGTDPRLMCERVRKAATVLARTFVPLAGGTPWEQTRQQPQPGEMAATGADACLVTARDAPAESVLAFEGRKGQDGAATTCTYTDGSGVKVMVWLSTDVPDDWQTQVPRLDEREITAATKLGTLPAYQQLTPSGETCAESVRYAEGEVLHVTYENRQRTPAELCRVAELIAGSAVNKMIDIPTN